MASSQFAAFLACYVFFISLGTSESSSFPIAMSPGDSKGPFRQYLILRGGATIEDMEYESDMDMTDEEEEDHKFDPLLTKSAMKSISKAKVKKATLTKQTMSAKLKVKKKSRGGILKALMVPYIIRASLNPVTLFSMTKAYFASLFNLNFLEKDESIELRSAKEEKAKKSPSSGGRKGKRQMKPGQAKTLSDLPQLSA